MNKYSCKIINLNFAFFEKVVDVFIGQKVLIKHGEKEIYGSVRSADLEIAKVELFGDVSGFVLDQTYGVFYDSFIQIPLSPSILGRQLDFFGQPIDSLIPIISVTKIENYYKLPVPNSSNSEIVGELDCLIKTDDFEIQKGQVKSIKDYNQVMPLLDISNLALIIVELDNFSLEYKKINSQLAKYDLDKVSVFFQSLSPKDIGISPFSVFQTAKYLSVQLGFDVLVIVNNSKLIESNKSESFYFVNNFDQIATFGNQGSITIIKS